MISIDEELYAPVAFRSFRPTPANVSLFHRAGVRLCQILCSGLNSTLKTPYSLYGGIWAGDGQYDFDAFDRQMWLFQRYAPESYIMVMIQLDTPEWWLQSHEGAPDSYYEFGQAVVSEEWKADAEAYLKAFIEYAEEHYGDRVFGYSFAAGTATEWFDNSFTKPNKAKTDAYRAHLKDPTARAPTPEELALVGDDVFRRPDSNEAKYLSFCCDLTAETICRFATAAQEVIRHRKILGLFFGYINCSSKLQNLWAINGYEKVWEIDDLDMIFSPAAYGENRELQGVSGYQLQVDSVELNNKLYLHEIDHRTHLANYPLETGRVLPCYETEFETTMVLRRELCASAAKGSALWWFDFFGGYYASPDLEEEVRRHVAIIERIQKLPRAQVAEIAVFADSRSFLLLREGADLHYKYVRDNLNELAECGAPFERFNLGDIERIDAEKYKMFVFLNAFSISDEIKTAITRRLAGKMKIWIHAPNYAEGDCENARAITRMVGMEIEPFASDSTEYIDFEGVEFGFGKPVAPMFEVTDNNVEVLGRFVANGKVGLARKGENVYCSVGSIPHQLWRHMARDAGAHIYCEDRGAMYVDSRFIARQTVHESNCVIHMPFDCEFEELFDGGKYSTKDGALRYIAQKGSTKLFLRLTNETAMK